MRGGLASRLAVYSSLVALVATATVGYMVYRGAEASLMRGAGDRVAHTAETVRVRVAANLDGIGNDVRFLAETPPVQGIVRARLRRGSVPLDPERSIYAEEWGELLAEIFRSFLVSRASYVQARFIGLAYDGLELVRVERRDGEVVFAATADLQRRADRDYFQEAIALPRGGIYVSSVRWGGEGEPTEQVPILHVATPVHSTDGELFGVVTVSVDFRQELAPIQPIINPNQTLYVADGEGRTLLISGDTLRVTGDRMQDAFAATKALLDGTQSELRLMSANLSDRTRGIAFFASLRVNPGEVTPKLFVGVTEPHDTILAGVRRVRNQSALITIFLCLAAIAVALGMSRFVTQPLRQITQAVAQFGEEGSRVALPVSRNDEIGVLARAFEGMEQQIEKQISELAEEVRERKEAEAARELLVKALEDERSTLRELSTTLEERVRRRTSDLERVNVELESSNRELRDIANVASHDLQEPLRKLRSFADLLQLEHAEHLDQEGRFYVQRIYGLAERMSHLITDLLAFSRITGHAKPFRDVSLDQVVKNAVASLSDSLDEVEGVVNVHELPVIKAEPVEMRVLVENLLTNAIKYRRPGVPPRVDIRAIIDDGEHPLCRLEVADNGVGFDEKYIDRIFTPFERLHDRRSVEGTGMGLAICRRIAENHRGTITARSQVGKGSTFVVTLPIRQKIAMESAT